jgi:hypothetical protein
VMFYDRPGGLGHPRETLVPRRVQLVVTFNVAVAIATPVLKWLTAWAIQCCTKTDGTKAASNHSRWLNTSPLSWLTAFGQTLNKTSLHIKGLLLTQDVVTRPGQLVRNRLERHDAIGTALLALVEALGLGAIA